MPYQDTMVEFGDWMPDDDRNIRPGFPIMWVGGSAVPLQDAKNVIYTGASYRPLQAPEATGNACPVAPIDAWTAQYGGVNYLIAGSANALYYSRDGGTSWNAAGGGFSGAEWQFAQYGNCVYAANGVNVIQSMDLSQGSPSFGPLASSSAPVALRIGIIRDFVVAGNITSSPIGSTTGAFVLQWSGLAAPATWDMPNTQQSRADQSGSQTLYSQYGAIQYIAQGEEMAMVFQQTGISRVQYVGGDVVFSFYTFDRKRGLLTPRAIAQIGNTCYFLAADGFYATDGQSVQPIGYGKIDRFFFDDCTDTTQVRAAADTTTQCVMWSYPNAAGWAQVVYNYAESKWTRGTCATPLLYQGMNGTAYEAQTFDANNRVNRFTGAQSDSELTTKDFRFDPSNHVLVVSLRLMTDDATATAGVAGRDQDSDPQDFVGYGNPEPVSRQISVRADGYMHAVNAKMTAAFTYCQGVGVQYALRGRR